jgi:hypothetical protein
VTASTGETSKAKDHAKAVKELGQALGAHRDAAAAEKALRELISMKGEVEYGATAAGRAVTPTAVVAWPGEAGR